MSLALNSIHQTDCVKALGKLTPGSIDLAFADPPFNIGYDYDVYDDRKESEAYLDWSPEWIGRRPACSEADRHVLAGHRRRIRRRAEAPLAGDRLHLPQLGHLVLHVRRQLQAQVQPLARPPVPLRQGPEEVHVQLERPGQSRPLGPATGLRRHAGQPAGRLPDDTWILRPQDLPDGFTPDEDTWYFPRVSGTFKERAGFHGCQMPEQLLGRIIRCCSNPGELVLDPFAGSGTTLVVAKKLGRQWLGFELSKDYAKRGRARVDAAQSGDMLEGAPEPCMSAPATPEGAQPNGKPVKKAKGKSTKGRSSRSGGERNRNSCDAIKASIANYRQNGGSTSIHHTGRF